MFTSDTYRGLLFFIWAAACQLSGSYFLWNAMRGNKSGWHGALGALLLIASALIMAQQRLPFGRVYAAYAGMLAMMALLWGWHYTRVRPDLLDMIGTIMVIGGIGIMYLTPRK